MAVEFRQSMSTETWASQVGRQMVGLRNSSSFRLSAGNSVFSIAEYLAQPAAMVIAAPFLVHRLGLQQYGIWMLSSAILGSVGILSTGFGDATVKYVSTYRALNDFAGVERTIRATLTINLTLAVVFGGLIWMFAPLAVHNIFKIEPALQSISVRAVQISAIILVLRSCESVFVSTLRAFERFGPPAKLNVFLRSIVVVSAVILTAMGHGVVEIMLATLFWSVVVVILQAIAARMVAGKFQVLPTLRYSALREVFSFGCFSWLQALAGVTFSYADRFIVAALLGTAPVAVYVICVQAAQPIHGLTAAGFNFLFPHLSSRHEAGEVRGPRRVFKLALVTNVVVAGLLSLPFLLLARPILRLWMGNQFADQGHLVLPILALSYAALAINVVPHNSLLALGRVRTVAVLNIAGGLVLLVVMAILIPHSALAGAAAGRAIYTILLAVGYLIAARKAFTHRIILAPQPIA
jgi:O-antigen/teichoic acid export membrane protein